MNCTHGMGGIDRIDSADGTVGFAKDFKKFIYSSFTLFLLSRCDSTVANWVDTASKKARSVKSSPATEIVPNLELAPQNYFVVRGENFNITSSNGTAPFTFSDLGSGYVNPTSGLFTVPLSSSLTDEAVAVTDSKGLKGTLPIKIQKWNSVSQVTTINTSADQNVVGITVTPNGTRFVAVNNYYEGYILKSTDGGATYTKVDSYTMYTSEDSHLSSIKAKSDLIIFAGGRARGGLTGGSNNYQTAYLRRSMDGGATWTLIDTFSTAHASGISSIEIDAAGSVYTSCYDGGNWKIKKSTDNGNTWTTVTLGAGGGRKLIYEPASGALYASGMMANSARIMKSTDLGASWVQIESFQGANAVTNMSDFAVRGSRLVHVGSSGNAVWSGFGWPTTCNGSSYLYRWYSRVSNDGGVTWTTGEDFNRVANRGSFAIGVVINAANEIIVAGNTQGDDDCMSVLIRKSTDGGATWSDTQFDNNTTPMWTETEFFGLVTGNEILHTAKKQSIAGPAYPFVYTFFPDIIQKSNNGGATWNPTSVPALQVPQESSGTTLTALDETTLLAGGAKNNQWIVKKSIDLGATWTDLDSYVHPAASLYSQYSTVNGVIKTSPSTLLAAGYAMDANYKYHWIVRRSTDGGANWVTQDDFLCAGTQSAMANSILQFSNSIYIVGNCSSAASDSMGIIRKSSDDGATWTTISTYQMATGAGKLTTFNKATVASDGTLYLLGTAVDSAGVAHLIVVKSPDNGVTLNLVLDEAVVSPATVNVVSGSIVIAKNALSKDAIFISYFSNNGSLDTLTVRKSQDGGATWQNSLSQLTIGSWGSIASLVASEDAIDVIVSSQSDDGMVQSFDASIWRTRDGSTWNKTDQSNASINAAVACGPQNQHKICAVGSEPSGFIYFLKWAVRLLSHN